MMTNTTYKIVQFESGHYGIARTKTRWFGAPIVSYLDLSTADSQTKFWRNSANYTSQCFSTDLHKVQVAFTHSTFAPGYPVEDNQILAVRDVIEMNKMAEKDEGLADLMLKAKEFYLLKKK